uniref:Immunoglobulin domain-containing protein n=1 Tax=Biomphalaria glabrata TaxID=6526 RepID=A0A2C9LKS2_BIOGL
MNPLLLLICVTWANAQNTLQAFLSKSVVMEGDPVTIICGTRHFESPSTTLICTLEIALFKLNATSGKFVELFFYNSILPSESQKNILVNNNHWEIQMKGFPEYYEIDFDECINRGLIDGNITIKIDKVKLQDAGMYQCALHEYNDPKERRYSQKSTANLTVKSPGP